MALIYSADLAKRQRDGRVSSCKGRLPGADLRRMYDPMMGYGVRPLGCSASLVPFSLMPDATCAFLRRRISRRSPVRLLGDRDRHLTRSIEHGLRLTLPDTYGMGMPGMMGAGAMGMGAMPGQQMMLYGRGMGGYGVGQA